MGTRRSWVQWRTPPTKATLSGQTPQPGRLAHWSPLKSTGPCPRPALVPTPGAGTHVVLESLGFARVLTRLSAVGRCTVQVPEHAVGGRGGRWFPHAPPPRPPPRPARTASHAPPPGMQEARGLPQRNVLLPADLQGRGKKVRRSLPVSV